MLIRDYRILAKTPKSSILGGTILPWTTTPSVTVALACVSVSALISALNSGFSDPSSAGHDLLTLRISKSCWYWWYQCLCHVLIERIKIVESVSDCVAYVTSGIANISRGVADGAANLAEEATLEEAAVTPRGWSNRRWGRWRELEQTVNARYIRALDY